MTFNIFKKKEKSQDMIFRVKAKVYQDKDGDWNVMFGRKLLPDAFKTKQEAIDYAYEYVKEEHE
jgi:hypothetical protein